MKLSKLLVINGGSVVSAVLSFLPLTCCAFPGAFSFLAVGGLASAAVLMPYRPYFIALTLAFVGAGFYFAYSPPIHIAVAAACAKPKSRLLQRVSLWAVTFAT